MFLRIGFSSKISKFLNSPNHLNHALKIYLWILEILKTWSEYLSTFWRFFSFGVKFKEIFPPLPWVLVLMSSKQYLKPQLNKPLGFEAFLAFFRHLSEFRRFDTLGKKRSDRSWLETSENGDRNSVIHHPTFRRQSLVKDSAD